MDPAYEIRKIESPEAIKVCRQLILPTLCVGALAWVVTFGIAFSWNKVNVFYDCYHTTYRMPLFTSLITVGSFIYAIKSTALLSIKREMFDRETPYRTRYLALCKDLKIKKVTGFIVPLDNIRKVLYYSILTSICGSLAQITIGLINNNLASITAVSCAAMAFFALGSALHHINSLFSEWFSHTGKEYDKEINDSLSKY